MREEADRGLQRRRQESERTQEQSHVAEPNARDTEKRAAWSVPGSFPRIAQPAVLRDNDLEEIANLTQGLDSTMRVDELHAIVARARVLAQRHDGDHEIQTRAMQVTAAVANRVESLTSVAPPPPWEPSAQPRGPIDVQLPGPQQATKILPPVASITRAESVSAEAATPIQVPMEQRAELPMAAGAENMSFSAPPLDKGTSRPTLAPAGERAWPEPIHISPEPPPPPNRFGLIGAVVFAVLLLAILVWKFWPSKTPSPTNVGTASKGALAVTSEPTGARIEVQNHSCITPECNLQLTAGDYEVKTSLPGYATDSRIIHVDSATGALNIELKPLPSRVHINTNFSSAEVALDGKHAGSLKKGQLDLADITMGAHKLKVSAAKENAELNFHVAPAQVPEIDGPISSENVSALLVSNLAGSARVFCNCGDGTPISIDGKALNPAQSGRRDLGAVTQGFHTIRVGNGDNAHSHIVNISAEPSLDVFLDAERNVGVLVIETGVENAAIYLDGHKAGQTGSDGTFRSTLPVQNVSVIVSKLGYLTPPQQIADVKKNAETGVTFELKRTVNKGTLLVASSLPETSITLDGQAIGKSDENGHFSAEVSLGNHVVEFEKSGYESKKLKMSFSTDKTEGLNATLTRNPPPSSAAPVQKQVSATPVLPPPAKSPAKQPVPVQPSPDEQDWQRVRETDDSAAMVAFLSHYPSSPFADQARQRLQKLQLIAERKTILLILSRYSDAYRHKKVDELQAVWPSVNRKKVAETFKSADTIRMDLVPVEDPSISADTATVKCDQRLFYNFGGKEKTFFDQITIRLRKQSGAWIIEGMN
jgi:hypothetical protein